MSGFINDVLNVTSEWKADRLLAEKLGQKNRTLIWHSQKSTKVKSGKKLLK